MMRKLKAKEQYEIIYDCGNHMGGWINNDLI